MSSPVRTERRGRVLEVTFDRPPVNAINAEASRALGEAFVELRDDPDLMVGIVTGGGDRIFSAGWDLKEVADPGFDLDKEYDAEQGSGPGGFAEEHRDRLVELDVNPLIVRPRGAVAVDAVVRLSA